MRNMRTICSIQGCNRVLQAGGMCGMHIKRLRRNGDPMIVTMNAAGEGTTKQGRKVITVEGKQMFEHVVIAERALGKPLPPGAVVHHVDEDPSNNAHDNLVICPNQAYHLLLHQRVRALDACGHADWLKCPFCKQYDDPCNLKIMRRLSGGRHGSMQYHAKCQAEDQRRRREEKASCAR